MEYLLKFFISYWIPLSLIMSFIWGVRVIHISYLDLSTQETSKLSYFFWFFYQFVFNFVGSFAGWVCFYILLLRTQSKLPNFIDFSWSDLLLFILSILGLTGHLPQTLYGLVVSIGKFAEAGAAKVTGSK
ncbi:hypothetical protein KJ966_12525 [bacterium]|nr:hypothetical protein [bacterium]